MTIVQCERRVEHYRLPTALPRLAACAGRTLMLLAQRRVHMPRRRVGTWVRFADGSTSRIYRETVLDRPEPQEPCVLIVQFRLRYVRGRGHRMFGAESLLNTPLFVAFPGFVSKLWLAADEHGVYRGCYDWDGPEAAREYVRALWWPLALVSDTASIKYQVLPGVRRDAVLAGAGHADVGAGGEQDQWWRPLATLPAAQAASGVRRS
ncbi:hypothetical protein AB0M47_08435 [Hamadaea sp. NPDC051192]|uniref:hypothetical protein n=1 Tax=Hamadaea sp. NPDC051192 TaxID=3154940 RepID=UPI00343C2427